MQSNGLLAQNIRNNLAMCGLAGCGSKGMGRDWFLADKVSSSDAVLGKIYSVKLDNIPPVDKLGRIAHLRGLYVTFTLQLSVPGATNDAVTVQDLLSCLTMVQLKDSTGAVFINNLGADVLAQEVYHRYMRYLSLPYDEWVTTPDGNYPNGVTTVLAANAGVDEYYARMGFYFPIAHPTQYRHLPRLDFLRPLALYQAQGRDSLRFQFGQFVNPIAGVTVASQVFQFAPAPTRVVTTEPAEEGYSVWADVSYEDAAVVCRRWGIDNYTLHESRSQLNYPDMITRMAVIQPRVGDTYSDVDGVSLDYAGQGAGLMALNTAEYITRNVSFGMENPFSALSRNAGEGPVPLGVTLVPFRGPREAPSGPITYNIATNPNTTLRFLHRYEMCHQVDDAEKIASALKGCGCNGATIYGSTPDGMVTTAIDPQNPIVIVPPRQSYGASVMR